MKLSLLILFVLSIAIYLSYGQSLSKLPTSMCTIQTFAKVAITTGTLVNYKGHQGVLVIASKLSGKDLFQSKIICGGWHIRLVAHVLKLFHGSITKLDLAVVVPSWNFLEIPGIIQTLPLPKKGMVMPRNLTLQLPSELSFKEVVVSAEFGGDCGKATGYKGICVDNTNNILDSFSLSSLPLIDPVSGTLFGIGAGLTMKELVGKAKIGVLIYEKTLVFVQPPSQVN